MKNYTRHKAAHIPLLILGLLLTGMLPFFDPRDALGHAQVVQPLPFDDTILLYMNGDKATEAAGLSLPGLFAKPDVSPFAQPLFQSNYAALANAESPFLYFFANRPQLSPDGRYLLVPGMDAQVDLNQPPPTFVNLVDLEEGTAYKVLDSSPLVRWSPQSDRFAYVQEQTLYTQSLVPNDTPRRLFSHPELNGGFLAWSPTNPWIAVTTLHTGEPAQAGSSPPITASLWLVGVDGGPTVELAQVPLAAIEHVPQELAWSHDGRQLVFMGTIIHLDGQQFQLDNVGLVNEWLPSRSLLLAAQGPELVLLTPRGERAATIGSTGGHFLERSISHDGHKIAYVEIGKNGQQTLAIYNIEAKSSHAVVRLPRDFGSIGYLAWNAHDNYLLVDNFSNESPIWATSASPDSELINVVDTGMLVQVLAQNAAPRSLAPTPEEQQLATSTVGQRAPHRFDVITQTLPSPDGLWVADVLVQVPKQDAIDPLLQPEYFQQLVLQPLDGSQELAPVKLWSPYGLGYDYPMLQQWSADNKSLYFAQGGPVDGCGVFSGPTGLSRFDVDTATTTQLISGGSWATLSPDERQMVLVRPDGLYIHTLGQSAVQVAERELGWPTPGGHPVWSLEGDSVAYTIAHNACSGGWAASTSVVLVDVTSMTQRELLIEDNRLLVTQRWLDETHLLLANPDEQSEWVLDIESGEVEKSGS